MLCCDRSIDKTSPSLVGEELKAMFGVPSADRRGLEKMDIDLGRNGAESEELGFLHDIFITVSNVLTASCNALRRKKLENLLRYLQ